MNPKLSKRISGLWSSIESVQNSDRKRFVVSAAVSLLSLLFLGIAAYLQGDSLVLSLQQANGWLLLATLLAYPIGMLPVAFAWHELMAGLDICSDVRTNLHNYALSCIPKRIPGAIWHIASRVVLYGSTGSSAARTVSASVLETLLLIFTGLALFVIAVVSGGIEAINPLWQAVTGVLAVLLVVLVTAGRSVLARLLVFFKIDPDTVLGTALGWRQLALIAGTCIAGWIGGGVLLFVTSRALAAVPLAKLPVFIGMWGGGGAVSLMAGFLVQGLGLREITLAVLLSGYMPFAAAVTVALLFRLILSLGELFWALIIARMTRG